MHDNDVSNAASDHGSSTINIDIGSNLKNIPINIGSHSIGMTSNQQSPIADRLAINQTTFHQIYELNRPKHKGLLKSIGSNVNCSSNDLTYVNYNERLWNQVKNRLPVLKWMTNYNFKKDLISDTAAGFTIGILHIPQGMAYSLLANVPPVVGLYVSFFPVLFYFLMGTSQHMSVGSSTLVCLMIGKIINQRLGEQVSPKISMKFSNEDIDDDDDADTDDVDDDFDFSLHRLPINATGTMDIDGNWDVHKVELAATACFLVGLIQFAMGVLQLGALSVYLSEMLISGFTTGSAIHSVTSQLKYLFGIPIKSRTGPMNLIFTYFDVLANIKDANISTCIISAVAIFSLLIINEGINVPFRDKLTVPVPVELLVIVAGTAASHFYNFNEKYKVQIVNSIPTGIPAPKPPQFSLMKDMLPDAIAIAIVIFSTSISVSKLLAKRHKYEIDATQELLAYGTSNIVGSLFSCFPSCASISRSLVQEVVGGKTQLASLLSCLLLLIVLLYVAPLFATLPNCILAAIIVVALKGMIRQVLELKQTWKISKLDAAIWMVTFMSVVIVDIEIGLGIGIVFSLLTVLFRTKNPCISVMGCVPCTDVYLDVKKFKKAKEIEGIKILHFGGGLYFANKDHFRNAVYKKSFNPQMVLANKRKDIEKLEREREEADRRNKSAFRNALKYSDVAFNNNLFVINQDYDSRRSSDGQVSQNSFTIDIHTIVLDCSAISFIDASGLATLHQMFLAFGEVNVQLIVADCQDNVTEKLEKSELYTVATNSIFPTIHDAVIYSLFQKTTLTSISIDSTNENGTNNHDNQETVQTHSLAYSNKSFER